MTIEDQIADDVLNGDNCKIGAQIPEPILEQLKERIAKAIRSDRARAARIVEMAPLDMSLEQLAVLIRQG